MTQLLSPGVYIEELAPASRTIAEVPTSIAAFVGPATRGPVGEATTIGGFRDFERLFGGLHPTSLTSQVVRHFYLNGGGRALIVRVAHEAGAGTLAAEATASAGAQWADLVATAAARAIPGFDHLRAVVTGLTATTFTLALSLRNAAGAVLTDGATPYQASTTVDVTAGPAATVAAMVTTTATPIALATWRAGSAALPVVPPNGTYQTRLRGEDHVVTLFAPFTGGLQLRATAQAQAIATADHVRITSAIVRGTTVLLTVQLETAGNAVIAGTGGNYEAAITVDLAGNIAAALAAGLSAATPQIPLVELVGAPTRVVPLNGTYVGTAVGATVTLPGPAAFGLIAANPGAWGNRLRAAIDRADAVGNDFHLRISELGDDGRVVDEEAFINVSFDLTSGRRVDLVLAERSRLVRVNGPLPGGAPQADTPQIAFAGGVNGDTPTVGEVEDALDALEESQFNLLCIPLEGGWDSGDAASIAMWETAVELVERRRAVVLIDPPSDWTDTAAAEAGAGTFPVTRSPNAALYFPNLILPNPLQESRPAEFPPCGAVAGVIARIDGDRGVWKAPAGLEAVLRGVLRPALVVRDDEAGGLNRLGVNAIWTRPLAGTVIWGARTLEGADALASQWKYLSVRRTALWIESSLEGGIGWAIFEGNDEPLWSQLRLSIGSFMQQAFRRGAFQGSAPQQAYMVQCDRETTVPDDQRRGVVNIVVGFAPLKPAEFVIIRLQQLTEQAAQ